MWAVMVQAVEPPRARPEEVQVTVPEALAHPGLAETKVVPGARASVTVNPALSLGPWLVAVMVEVTSVPAVAGCGESDLVMDRSACVSTVVSAVEVLLAVSGSVVVEVTAAVLEMV